MARVKNYSSVKFQRSLREIFERYFTAEFLRFYFGEIILIICREIIANCREIAEKFIPLEMFFR